MYPIREQAVPILPKTKTETNGNAATSSDVVRTTGVRARNTSGGAFISWRIGSGEEVGRPSKRPAETETYRDSMIRRTKACEECWRTGRRVCYSRLNPQSTLTRALQCHHVQTDERTDKDEPQDCQDVPVYGYHGTPTFKLSDLHHKTSSDWFGNVCIPAEQEVFSAIDRAFTTQSPGPPSSGDPTKNSDRPPDLNVAELSVAPETQSQQLAPTYGLFEDPLWSTIFPFDRPGSPFDLVPPSGTDNSLIFDDTFLGLDPSFSATPSLSSYTQVEPIEPWISGTTTANIDIPSRAPLRSQRFSHWINSSPSEPRPTGPRSAGTVSSSFSCTACSKEYCRKSDLAHHLRYHERGAHKCAQCDATFHFAKDLQRHSMKHTGQRVFFCKFEECRYYAQGFKRNDHLQRHYKKVHDASEDQSQGRSESQRRGSEHVNTPKASSSVTALD